jgi:DNA-binding transcriptional ArsR family regulator
MFGENGNKNKSDAKRASRILECLSSPVRLLIVCSLIDGAKNVSAFSSKIGTTKGNISQHLRILEDNGILESEKRGNMVFYSIKNRKVINLIKEIKKICSEEKLASIK